MKTISVVLEMWFQLFLKRKVKYLLFSFLPETPRTDVAAFVKMLRRTLDEYLTHRAAHISPLQLRECGVQLNGRSGSERGEHSLV